MRNANYISASKSWESDSVVVWERQDGIRNTILFDSPYYFYVKDPDGEFTSMYGDKLTKLSFKNQEEFDDNCLKFKIKFESDISLVDKVLMDNYYDVPPPNLNVAFLDIESDTLVDLGWSSVENPYAPVNAITIFKKWLNSYFTLVIPPKKWSGDHNELILKFKDKTNLTICTDETELLTKLLSLIEDVDILSGWNSDFYDLPYLVKRTEMTLGAESMKLWCFQGAPKPRWGEVARFGMKQQTVKIYGRVHLDYLQLFKKFTFEGRSSFALGAIAEEELDIPKLDFDGSFEEFYNNNFEKFISYNIRDVEILEKLDEKFNFIALANQMAHENTVPIDAVLGTIKIVETGITNFAHHKMGLIVKNRDLRGKGETVEGAIVINPRVGLHEWIGSFDIASLYPNTQRSINISPEKIIGQFTNGEEDWFGIYQKDNNSHCLEMDNGETLIATGLEWKEILIQEKWAISGFGTVFNQDAPGIIPLAIKFWFTERKRLQAEKRKHSTILKDLQKSPEENIEEITQVKKLISEYDLRQQTMKIFLNSGYGALLSEHYKFGDPRMGASTTGTGRQITTFMNETIGKLLTGDENVKLVKDVGVTINGITINSYSTTCPSILTGDTDSCFALLDTDNYKDAILIADEIGILVNKLFPDFMVDAFCCQPGFHDLISASREVVAERGLFIAKKKYVLKVVNVDGDKVNKLKAMGMETKKSDTPKVIQKFLTDVVTNILDGKKYNVLEDYIILARTDLLKEENLMALGIPKSVNNLDEYYEQYTRYELTGKKKINLPGHVRASCNYNEYAQRMESKNAKLIRSGDKVKVFYLLPNEENYKSIAIPVDLPKWPSWLLDNFKIDKDLSEQKMIDAKLRGIFDAMNWTIPTVQNKFVRSILEF